MNVKLFTLIKRNLNGIRGFLVPYLPLFRKFQLILMTAKAKLCCIFRKKADGYRKYSVVVACYNVEEYLEDFFKSFEYQSLDFKNNFQLILVDDGSTDNTKTVIEKWVRKYPHNIEYLYQTNMGQAAARNLGLSHVRHPWVTFIDPDDFLDCNAFRNIDGYLKSCQDQIDFVSMRIIPFYESGIGFLDNHPLSYKFKKTTIRDIDKMDDYIQLSAASGLFKTEIIKRKNLQFNPKCKPSFEDALFVNQYFLNCLNGKVIYAKDVIYFYRKRVKKNSTLDGSAFQKGYFLDVFQNGVLQLLELTRSSCGYLPEFIQNVAAYHCLWFIKTVINRPDIGSFLTPEEKEQSCSFLKNVFESLTNLNKISYIDYLGWNAFLRQCVANLINHSDIKQPEVVIRKFDLRKSEILLEYSGSNFEEDVFFSDSNPVTPSHSKVANDTLFDYVINQRRYLWLPIYKGKALSYQINAFSSTKFVLMNNGQVKEIEIPSYDFSKFVKQFTLNRRDLWLLCDRDRVADDNAEHLYRYLMKNHSDIRAYFLLDKKSPDWQRLKSEGFKLIAFGSFMHHFYLKRCTCIISSHADPYVFDYFKDGCAKGVPFVFLQHGVTKDDISEWLNSVNIDLIITSSIREYQAFVKNHGRYKFTKKEVKLTGMPRQDSLLKKNNPEKMILIMPTWRKSVVGQLVTKGNKRTINPQFYKTVYAKTWFSLFKSERLKKMCKTYGYKVCLFPHENIRPYIHSEQIPDYIHVVDESEGIQNLFGRCALLITDYSSVAFDVAYLEKPVIYYQFDQKDVFGQRSHIYSPGYFSYKNDGFGDIVRTEGDLLMILQNIMVKNEKIQEKYLRRMRTFFKFKDGQNCQRVFDAIKSL